MSFTKESERSSRTGTGGSTSRVTSRPDVPPTVDRFGRLVFDTTTPRFGQLDSNIDPDQNLFGDLDPRSGEVVVGGFAGPAFGPGGDVFVTPTELRGDAKRGFFEPSTSGRIARQPDGSPLPFGDPITFGQSAAAGGSGGRGGGGGGRAASFGIGSLRSSSPEALRDRLIGLYEQWTGAFPDRPSLDFVTNQALGGESVFNIRGNVQATPEFKSRFKNMPAGMDIREYDQALVQVNSQALQIAGRPVTDQELALYFAGNGTAVYESFKGGPPPNSEIPPAPPKQEQIVKPAKTEQVLAPDSKIELEEV